MRSFPLVVLSHSSLSKPVLNSCVCVCARARALQTAIVYRIRAKKEAHIGTPPIICTSIMKRSGSSLSRPCQCSKPITVCVCVCDF